MKTKRIFFWATVVSGVLEAYLMYRRGEDWQTIAKESTRHPIGTMINEVKEASS